MIANVCDRHDIQTKIEDEEHERLTAPVLQSTRSWIWSVRDSKVTTTYSICSSALWPM